VARWGGYTVNLIHYEDAASVCVAVSSSLYVSVTGVVLDTLTAKSGNFMGSLRTGLNCTDLTLGKDTLECLSEQMNPCMLE